MKIFAENRAGVPCVCPATVADVDIGGASAEFSQCPRTVLTVLTTH